MVTFDEENPNVAQLSPREREVIVWLCMGKTNWEIGAILDISVYTVKNHVRSILQKLNARNRVHVVRMIIKDEQNPVSMKIQ